MSHHSDLVSDSRLETTFQQDGVTIHRYAEAEGSARQVRRKEYWKRERRVGRGGFGQVQLQTCVKGRRKDAVRAVKILDKPRIATIENDLHAELHALAKFSRERYSSWFVQSFGWYEDAESVFIAMEYCPHGDLNSYLKENHTIRPEEAKQIAYQIIEGLEQMHRNDFVHRDLKPGNILIKSKPPEQWWVVLADFGISKRLKDDFGPSTVKGTQSFMAPELLRPSVRGSSSPAIDFKACDVWAAGEVINLMIMGETSSRNIDALCNNDQSRAKMVQSTGNHDDAFDLLDKMMAMPPSSRMSVTEALKHPWLQACGSVEEETTQILSTKHHLTAVSDTDSENEGPSAVWTTAEVDGTLPNQTISGSLDDQERAGVLTMEEVKRLRQQQAEPLKVVINPMRVAIVKKQRSRSSPGLKDTVATSLNTKGVHRPLGMDNFQDAEENRPELLSDLVGKAERFHTPPLSRGARTVLQSRAKTDNATHGDETTHPRSSSPRLLDSPTVSKDGNCHLTFRPKDQKSHGEKGTPTLPLTATQHATSVQRRPIQTSNTIPGHTNASGSEDAPHGDRSRTLNHLGTDPVSEPNLSKSATFETGHLIRGLTSEEHRACYLFESHLRECLECQIDFKNYYNSRPRMCGEGFSLARNVEKTLMCLRTYGQVQDREAERLEVTVPDLYKHSRELLKRHAGGRLSTHGYWYRDNPPNHRTPSIERETYDLSSNRIAELRPGANLHLRELERPYELGRPTQSAERCVMM